MRKFLVKEVFATIQGEGPLAGCPAVFVRFSGCNIWSGHEKHRERDSANGLCALFCDTDFVGGTRYDADDLADEIESVALVENSFDTHIRSVVLTGGEPLLQLSGGEGFKLFLELEKRGFMVQFETNGSIGVDDGLAGLWESGIISRPIFVVSPKPPMAVKIRHTDWLKVVWPSCGEALLKLTEDGWLREDVYGGGKYPTMIAVQPEDGPNLGANTASAVEFVLRNPVIAGVPVRLSVQLHKIVGVL